MFGVKIFNLFPSLTSSSPSSAGMLDKFTYSFWSVTSFSSVNSSLSVDFSSSLDQMLLSYPSINNFLDLFD